MVFYERAQEFMGERLAVGTRTWFFRGSSSCIRVQKAWKAGSHERRKRKCKRKHKHKETHVSTTSMQTETQTQAQTQEMGNFPFSCACVYISNL